MRVIVFLLLSLFVIANLAADNEIWEVTVGGAKKIDPSLPEYNYFGTNAGRVKRNAQSVVKTNSLTWNVAYQDVEQNTGVGFDDPIEGPKVNAIRFLYFRCTGDFCRFYLIIERRLIFLNYVRLPLPLNQFSTFWAMLFQSTLNPLTLLSNNQTNSDKVKFYNAILIKS